MMRLLALALLLAATVAAQPKRILYITHSAGFRHDSILHSIEVLKAIANSSGKLEIVQTEDVSLLNAAALRGYDAVLFYTTGELPVSAAQKNDLLSFIRGGKGFGGVHSATDTFYEWPEYGDLIGAWFNGHPWTQAVNINVEDPDNAIVAHLKPSFRITDEIYQFRNFSREKARVLLKLDTRSVNMHADGVNPGTEDFPLAWIRQYGNGRSFYSALGHFNEVWDHPGVRQMLLQGMLWMTGQLEVDARPRAATAPALSPAGVVNSASFTPPGVISPGSLITIFGEHLTSGSTLEAELPETAFDLAGTTVKIDEVAAPLLYASPTQLNAYVPLDLQISPHTLEVSTPGRATVVTVDAAPSTPGVFVITTTSLWAILWCTGLGAVEQRGDLSWTLAQPSVTIGGAAAPVLYSGLAPGWLGLYQVNVGMPPQISFPARLEFQFGGYTGNFVVSP
jgi:type 1 glutamine amidotransferase